MAAPGDCRVSASVAQNWLRLAVYDAIPRPRVPLLPELLADAPLRDYQHALMRRAALAMLAGYRRILVQLPTGGGKTEMAKAAVRSALLQLMRAYFLVHRKELIDQTSASFERSGIPHGFIASGRPFDPTAAAVLAGVQTLVNRLDSIQAPDLAIVDEAHHAVAASWDDILQAFEDDGSFILALTATPERLDGSGLDEHFDLLLCGPTVAELIDDAYLSHFNYYAPPPELMPDFAGVASQAGDFNRSQAAERMDKPHLVGDIVDHYLRLCPGEPGIFFAQSIEHSKHVVEAFRSRGVSAAHVDGTSKDREDSVNGLKRGDVKLLSNVDLFGEGFDLPGIVYVGLGRRTKSLSLYMQMCGRSFRPMYAPGMPLDDVTQRLAAIAAGAKAGGAIICDHAGNAFQHGLPDEEREWTLKGREKGKSNGPSDAMPVRQCISCYRISPSSMAICPGCQTEFPVQVRRALVQKEGKLEKLERVAREKEDAQKRRLEEKKCRTWADFFALAERRGKGPNEAQAWASLRMRVRKQAASRWSR